METSKNVAGQVILGTILAEAYLRSGELKTAEKTLQKCLALATSSGMKLYVGWPRRLLGEVAFESNPHQATEPLAAPHFEAAVSILRDIDVEPELALAYAAYGRLLKSQGRTCEARDNFTRALEIFDRLGILAEPDKMRAELAALPESGAFPLLSAQVS
jgi:tetratricopeptide (TPR) repeat protein